MHNERTNILISAQYCHLKKLEKESYNSLTLTAAENKITTQLTSLLNMRRIASPKLIESRYGVRYVMG